MIRLLNLNNELKCDGAPIFRKIVLFYVCFQGYQFWTRTDEHGNFYIKAVLPGAYNLHAWVSGVMGNYMYEATVTVTPGTQPHSLFHGLVLIRM